MERAEPIMAAALSKSSIKANAVNTVDQIEPFKNYRNFFNTNQWASNTHGGSARTATATRPM